MFLQKFKAGLRFLGVLFLRILLGIVVGYLWMFAVAFIFHTAVGSPPMSPPFGHGRLSIFEIFDHFYDSGPPREWRYRGTAGEDLSHCFTDWIDRFLGIWFAVGVLWGFLQGRLDLRRWLRRRHA